MKEEPLLLLTYAKLAVSDCHCVVGEA